MKTLIAFELKKILNRKVLWVMLAFGLAMMAWVDKEVIQYRTSGYLQGWRAVIAQYEGQTITEAFRQQALSDYNQYVAGNAEHFVAYPSDAQGGLRYHSKGFDYYLGAGSAYDRLTQMTTLESEQEQFADAQQYLKNGTWEDGKPLDAGSRRYFERYVHRGPQTPVLHDAKGWQDYLDTGKASLPGMVAMILSALALLGAFNGEASARMEAVVLTTKARRRLTTAKLLAGGCAACAVALLFLALHVGVFAWAYMLDGAHLPAGQVYFHYATDLTVAQAFALSNGVTVLAVLACAAVAAWASAQFRHPLLALLVAGAVLGAMMGVDGLINTISNLSDSLLPDWVNLLHEYAFLLPTSALYNHYGVFYGMDEPLKLAFLLACPSAITALFCWLAQYAFLRRRRA